MSIRKTVNAILSILFVVVVPVALLLTSVQLAAFDREYYKNEYIKYKIPEHLGMEMEELMDSTEKLLLYLENKRDNLDFESEFKNGTQEFFSQRDKQHMVDVKMLFDRGRAIRNFSVIYMAAFLLLLYRTGQRGARCRSLAGLGLAVFAVGILPVIILIILMNADFYKYFTIFHEIFFDNDLWLLDPAADRLINMFPQDFFSDIAFRISYFYIGGMAAILTASLVGLWLCRRTSK